MKLLSLNSHSLRERDYAGKLHAFSQFLLRERPDIIALQEVNQSQSAPPARELPGFSEIGNEIPLRQDNHALAVARYLIERGAPCSWVWLPVKRGYGIYDEGISLMSMGGEIAEADFCTVSKTDDYENWRTRRLLGIRIKGNPDWFYSAHLGWWNDEAEPVAGQWRRLEKHLSGKRARSRIWLLGDFNAPAEVRGEGYDLIVRSGWRDAYLLAEERSGGITVRGEIDGWRGAGEAGMRIDHIWVSAEARIARCRTVFDGVRDAQVSDHFGVFLETGEGEHDRS